MYQNYSSKTLCTIKIFKTNVVYLAKIFTRYSSLLRLTSRPATFFKSPSLDTLLPGQKATWVEFVFGCDLWYSKAWRLDRPDDKAAQTTRPGHYQNTCPHTRTALISHSVQCVAYTTTGFRHKKVLWLEVKGKIVSFPFVFVMNIKMHSLPF